eukprot:COSAG04_NODE_109_length_25931_cov_38.787279_23_plen_293_part_00
MAREERREETLPLLPGAQWAPAATPPPAPPAVRLRRCVGAVLAAVVLSSEFSGTALLVWFGEEPLQQFTPWLAHQRSAGLAIFLGIWVVCSIGCLPSTPLWLLGGFCFKSNLALGFGLNVLGCYLGTMVCFGLGRLLRRGCGGAAAEGGGCCCEEGCEQSRTLRILNSLLAENEIKATLLSRIAYAPMAVKNYGFGGFTPVSIKCFAVCSVLGDLPNTLLFTHLGGSVSSLVEALKGQESLGIAPRIGLAVSLTITALILGAVALLVRRVMRDEEVRATRGRLQEAVPRQAG